MSDHDTEFGNRILNAALLTRQLPQAVASLHIAVLGPGLAGTDDLGRDKRRQIFEALKKDGHDPFFPEEFVNSLDPFAPLLDQERILLTQPNVDLVIILCTPSSYGVLMEIANFVSVPEIKAKTAVLFPVEFYTPEDSLSGNTVRDYHTKLPYTERHIERCQLVSECRKWAEDRRTGVWTTPPHGP